MKWTSYRFNVDRKENHRHIMTMCCGDFGNKCFNRYKSQMKYVLERLEGRREYS
jgi:hypothetical protein